MANHDSKAGRSTAPQGGTWNRDALKQEWLEYDLAKTLKDFCRERGIPYNTATKWLRDADRIAHQIPGSTLEQKADCLIGLCWRILRSDKVAAPTAVTLLPKLLSWLDNRASDDGCLQRAVENREKELSKQFASVLVNVCPACRDKALAMLETMP